MNDLPVEAPKSRIVQFRQWLGGSLIKWTLTGLSYAARVSPSYWAGRDAFQRRANIFYTEEKDPARALDIYTPTGSNGPFPVVFFVHGGGFRICSKDTHWMMAHRLVKRGYLVVSINYRLVPKVRYPYPAEDTARAFEWFAENLEGLRGNPNQLFLMGESAGANLVSMLQLCLNKERSEPWAKRIFNTGLKPIGLIPQCGLLQVHEIDRYQNEAIPTWMADRIERVAKDYLGPSPSTENLLASPLSLIEAQDLDSSSFPPVFAPVGGNDPIVSDTVRLEAALKQAGVWVKAPVYPNAGHAFHAMGTRSARECWKDTFQFMDQCINGTIPVGTAN